MDWGLFDSKANDNTFLREEIVYSSTVCSSSKIYTIKLFVGKDLHLYN